MNSDDKPVYSNPRFFIQDKISENPQAIKEALSGLYYVPTPEVAKLPKYIWVRYINHQGLYRTGGILWGNYYPRYLLLLNPKTRYPWKIGIVKNHFYVRDCKAKLRERYEKDKLHQLYLEDKLIIKPEVLESDNIDQVLEAGREFEPTDYAPLITTVSREDYKIYRQLSREDHENQKAYQKKNKQHILSIKTQTRSVSTNTDPISGMGVMEPEEIRDIKNKLFELYQDNLLTLNDSET